MKYLFDEKKLDTLMENEGLSLILANSRHNIRYLTGGFFYHFHARSSRMARSQYLPFVGIPKGRLKDSFYIGRKEERGQIQSDGLWIPNMVDTIRGTVSAAESAIKTVKMLGLEKTKIGVELPFIPADTFLALQKGLPGAELVDGTALLDELRTIKSTEEIDKLRKVYGLVAESIQAAFSGCYPGISTKDIERKVELEMTKRGVGFLFSLICAGPGFLRAPSLSSTWEKGQVLHIDSGGEQDDYIADICRMGCIGKPSDLANDLYLACLEVQNTVRAIVKPGLPCNELLKVGLKASKQYPFSEYSRFVAHGIGMVPYEQPSITLDNTESLEEGMILSIETDFLHPGVGHVKIEDAVVVAATGSEGLGDLGRQWHIL
jgi:Xaa-Pro aminopeptidase